MSAGAKRGRSDIEFDVDTFLETTTAMRTDLDSMVLGIDEAGRGPAIGPMVYGGCVVALRHHQAIIDAGAADSKTLTEAAREAIRVRLDAIPTLQPIVKALSADEISTAMFSRSGRNLNTLSHETAVQIIEEATLICGGKLAGVFVDTVGIAEAYQRMLCGRFPHLHIIVTKKADSKFPIVSAASIYAKTDRDRFIVAAAKQHGRMGSGYPGDAETVNWIQQHVHRFFGFAPRHNFVRHSWGPVAALQGVACVKMEFQHQEKDNDKGTQRLTGGPLQQRRDTLFTHMLGLAHTPRLTAE